MPAAKSTIFTAPQLGLIVFAHVNRPGPPGLASPGDKVMCSVHDTTNTHEQTLQGGWWCRAIGKHSLYTNTIPYLRLYYRNVDGGGDGKWSADMTERKHTHSIHIRTY